MHNCRNASWNFAAFGWRRLERFTHPSNGSVVRIEKEMFMHQKTSVDRAAILWLRSTYGKLGMKTLTAIIRQMKFGRYRLWCNVKRLRKPISVLVSSIPANNLPSSETCRLRRNVLFLAIRFCPH
ncbi:hypothetical protein M514_12656, partial [Trichuris suis]